LYLVCCRMSHYVIQNLKENPNQDIEAAVTKEQMAIQSVVGNLTLGSIKALAIQLENCLIPDNTSHRLLQIRLHEDGIYFASEFIQEKIFNQFQSPQAYNNWNP